MYDVIIIGAGPAGLTAGIYCARKKLKTLILSRNIGGQTRRTWGVENYLGFTIISGPELTAKFQEHIEKFDVKIKERIAVEKIIKKDKTFQIKTTRGEIYESKTVIVASGKKPKKLDIINESEYVGRGLTYCATCDAPLFAKKDVAVIGGGNAALETVLQLMEIAEKIYLIDIAEKLSGDEIMQEKIKASKKVEIINDTEIKEIKGNSFLDQINVQNKKTGKTREINVEGVFIEIGSTPNVDFIKDLVKLNEFSEIKIDKRNMTSLAGIFAAGDVTEVIDKQIIIAAGEGAKAALGAYNYLVKQK